MDNHKNFAYSTVATAPSPATSGTSLTVAAGQGTRFPTAPFNATVWPANSQPLSTNAEIVRITAIATDVFTIVRAQEGSSARTVIVGDQIAATITDKTLTDIQSLTVSTISSNTTLTTQDVVFASGTITLTLPSAVTATRPIYIKNVGTGTIKVVGPSSQTIDGTTQLNINVQYEAYTLVSDGANWFIL